MEIFAWCLAAAAITGVLVYVLMSRGRGQLEHEVIRLQAEAAALNVKIADQDKSLQALAADQRSLNASFLEVSADRERLATSLTRAMEDLQQASATSTRQQQALEAAQASGSQAVSDLRVMTAKADTLAQQLVDLQARVAALTEETHQQVANIERLTASSAALRTERDGLNERLAEQKAWVEEQTRHFEQRVEISTQKLLEERSKAFSEVNRKELDSIVAPFKDQLKEFRERVDHIHSADARDRGQLHQQIQQLTSLNQTVSKAADDLTNALTISTKQTGDWGETILKRILEESGLQEGREYQLQVSIVGVEGEDRRPDAVISLPEGRQLVIDAKVSNKA